MVDFPSGTPDIVDASVAETLFTMHGGAGHVAATNRVLLNLQQLAVKLGSGASAPGAVAALLRRTASGQSAWGPLQNGDIPNDTIAGAKLAPLTLDDSRVSASAAISPLKLAPLQTAGAFCNLTSTGAQSIPTGASTPIVFGAGTELQDPLGMHDTTTLPMRIVIPAGWGGLYLIMCYVYWETSVGVHILDTKLTEASLWPIRDGDDGVVATTSQFGAGVWPMTPGQYIAVEVFQNSGVARTIGAGYPTRLMAVFLG